MEGEIRNLYRRLCDPIGVGEFICFKAEAVVRLPLS
jgi:hypothetical protein